MSPALRMSLLGTALAATLAAVFFAPQPETAVVSARVAPRAALPVPDTLAEPLPARSAIGAAQNDLFAARDWSPPPPPPVQAPAARTLPPPPPQAPPLPYRYAGHWQTAEGLSVFVAIANGMPRSISAGQTLDGVWRVDAIESYRILFTYLPLDKSVILFTGGSL
jgi:hypothetical protein